VGEDLVGRSLQKGEIVHHKNNIRHDNRPENLEVMTVKSHRQHHAAELRNLLQIPLDRAEVEAALLMHGAIKPAAKSLGCSHNTLRLRFPELCAPHQRTSPTQIDNPRDTEQILDAAPRRDVGIHEIADRLNMSTRTILRICERHGVKWAKKKRSDAGQPRATPWQ
jgi:hypothetical protein